MSKIFKAKFRDIMKSSCLYFLIDSGVWNQDLIVNCQAIGAGEHSLKYLAPYVFKLQHPKLCSNLLNRCFAAVAVLLWCFAHRCCRSDTQ
jgi:hypothetical protein